jgi:heptosyltransferase-3
VKRTILIIHPGALGDVLLAVPAIRSLSLRFPRHEIVLIAAATVSRLLWECGVISDWLPLEGQACLEIFSGTSSISKELYSCVNRCDRAVVWMEDNEGVLGSFFQEFGVASVQIQSPFSKGLRARHQSDRFLETLGEPTRDRLSERTVQVPPHLLERGRDYLDALKISQEQSLVLVHPGSGSVHKRLEPRRMASLIERLWQEGMYPLILEGPADQDAVGQALHFMSRPPLVLRDLDLSQLAGVFGRVAVYIGHDSGVTHLAALLGVRTIAIFGPTDQHRWGPYGGHVSIVRGLPCGCESWETVKLCVEKHCLHVPVEKILEVSRLTYRGTDNTSPHNSPETALSLTTPQ